MVGENVGYRGYQDGSVAGCGLATIAGEQQKCLTYVIGL